MEAHLLTSPSKEKEIMTRSGEKKEKSSKFFEPEKVA
jgi:hypothetical protein